jgi:hypothetical protein
VPQLLLHPVGAAAALALIVLAVVSRSQSRRAESRTRG